MLGLSLPDQRDFMNKLLLGEAFDSFWMVEASITTFNTFHIDGLVHQDFLDEPLTERSYSLWREVRPFCLSVIKGKRIPLHFKMVFQYPKSGIPTLLEECHSSLSPEDVQGLFLNLQFHQKQLTCTTGTSIRLFSMDKSLDHLWDEKVLTFLKNQKIPFQRI